MEVVEIPMSRVRVSSLNARTTLHDASDETTLDDLAADLRTRGLINPLTVRSVGEGGEAPVRW